MTKAIHINARSRAITFVEVHTLAEIQFLVGGMIETAPPCGADVTLYVNEEGRINGTTTGFMFGRSGVLAGNGVLMGPPDGEGYDTDITLTLDQVVRTVVWVGEAPDLNLKEFGADLGKAEGRRPFTDDQFAKPAQEE